MRPPMTKRLDSQTALGDSKSEALREKAELARHLHEQGVNPLRWTEAQPAPQSDQQAYQSTGQKPRDNQFDAKGKLYNWSPEVTATSQQAKAIADAYIAERSAAADTAAPAPRIEDLVDIEQVPLKHPLGTPHLDRPANDMSTAEERTALIRHYAQSGVDPDKAHLGDPPPVKDQERLKAELAKLLPGDKSEISGLPAFYQGFDDGWIYRANAHTAESDEVKEIRLSGNAGANDNATTTEDAVVQHYLKQQGADGRPMPSNLVREADVVQTHLTQALESDDPESSTTAELERISASLPSLIAITEKVQAQQALTPADKEALGKISRVFDEVGIDFDPSKTKLAELRNLSQVISRLAKDARSRGVEVPAARLDAFNMSIAEALAGGTMPAVLAGQGRMGQITDFAIRHSLAGKAFVTALEEIRLLDRGPRAGDVPDILDDIGPTDSRVPTRNPEQATGVEDRPQQRELKPASQASINSLNSGLADANSVEIFIGGIPLFKQSEHKTLMDEIFRTEFIKVAQENGCLPGPEGKQWDSHGGSKPQKRITDVDQAGHLGSRQGDGWIRWENNGGSWTEMLWNSTSTLIDGFTDTVRELAALKDIIVKADKQVALGRESMERLRNRTAYPVQGEASVVHMGEKPNWSEAELRKYISKKVRDFFNKNIKNCKFVGEFRIQKLDSPDDPDLPPTSPR